MLWRSGKHSTIVVMKRNETNQSMRHVSGCLYAAGCAGSGQWPWGDWPSDWTVSTFRIEIINQTYNERSSKCIKCNIFCSFFFIFVFFLRFLPLIGQLGRHSRASCVCLDNVLGPFWSACLSVGGYRKWPARLWQWCENVSNRIEPLFLLLWLRHSLRVKVFEFTV